jgi:hypothetical protein
VVLVAEETISLAQQGLHLFIQQALQLVVLAVVL